MDEDKYADAAHRLAELLGWSPSLLPTGETVWTPPDSDPQSALPDWTGDNHAAFQLMLTQGLKVDCTDTDERFICYVHTGSRHGSPYVAEHYEDHMVNTMGYEQRKELATRFAIVTAAILKLEAKLESKAVLSMAY